MEIVKVKKETQTTLIKCLIAVAVVLAVLGVHRMSYDDEVAHALYACQMVEQGIWPEHFCVEK